jgi:uncharacterized protein YdhG (YjbR/CyaY superfamily)
MEISQAKTIDEFIAEYPNDIQTILQQIRETIHKTVPDAKEKISYGIPTFTFHGNLVHFSAYEKHIGFYPGAAPIAEFKDKLKEYETSKGTVRFPIDKPIPLDLIKQMTLAAVERNLGKLKK